MNSTIIRIPYITQYTRDLRKIKQIKRPKLGTPYGRRTIKNNLKKTIGRNLLYIL